MTTNDLIAESRRLAELAAKATPGPWNRGGIFDPDGKRPHCWVWGPREKPEHQSGSVLAKELSLPDGELMAVARSFPFAAVADTLAKLERFEKRDDFIALISAYQQLRYLWETTRSCPCGARAESLHTHPHVISCPTAAAVVAGIDPREREAKEEGK